MSEVPLWCVRVVEVPVSLHRLPTVVTSPLEEIHVLEKGYIPAHESSLPTKCMLVSWYTPIPHRSKWESRKPYILNPEPRPLDALRMFHCTHNLVET